MHHCDLIKPQSIVITEEHTKYKIKSRIKIPSVRKRYKVNEKASVCYKDFSIKTKADLTGQMALHWWIDYEHRNSEKFEKNNRF